MRPEGIALGTEQEKGGRRVGVPAVIGAIIEAGSVYCEYQPIVSARDARVLGVEALARGRNPLDGATIPPTALFEAAAGRGLSLELDRLCRRRAVEGFAAAASFAPELVLFMNVDTRILSRRTIGSNKITDLASELGVEPRKIAIEILEAEGGDESLLKNFTEHYKRQGFLVALDDLGSGYSNLERAIELEPDIIKIDRSIVSGIERDYRKQRFLECLARLCSRIGVAPVAEGVETTAQAQTCLALGSDLMQGFLLARPGTLERESIERCEAETLRVIDSFKSYERRRIAERRELRERYDRIADALEAAVANRAAQDREAALAEALALFPEAECAYALDRDGRQVTATVFNPARGEARKSALFMPASAGTDQSTKDYFLGLEGQGGRYATEPYISRASGFLCATISTALRYPSDRWAVLCLDVVIDG
jgi:FOG: EAL domain